MDVATSQVLFELATVTVGALVVGLLLFGYVRKRGTEIGWQYHGNVWTEPFDILDLVAAALLVLFYFSVVAAPALMSPEAIEKAVGESSNPIPDVGTAIAFTAFSLMFGVGVFCFATFIRGRNPAQLFGLDRLSPGKVLAWAVAAMVPIYLVMSAVIFGIWKPLFEGAWGAEEDLQNVVEALVNSSDPIMRAVLIGSAVIVAPLVEEVIFRGYIYPVFKRFSDRFLSAIVTSMLFALVHGNVPGTLPLFALALMLTIAYELTGCLWVPIAIHALFNAIQTALMLNLGDA